MLSNSIKSYLRRTVLQWRSVRPFCDHVEGQIVTSSCVSKLAELLGCSEEHADFLVRKNKKIVTADTYHISRVASFCRTNLNLKDILEYPTVISLSPEVLDDRMSALKELGCRALTARNLLLFHQYMQMTPSKLRWKGYLTDPESSFSQVVNQLNCPVDLKIQLTSKLADLHTSNIQLEKIKASVNAQFLVWKLQCSEQVVTDMIKKVPSLCTKSLNSLEKVCEMLLEKFELPASKVCGSPKLLTVNCSNAEDLVLKVPKICGVSVYHMVKKQPLILKRSAESILDTVCALERHGITDIQLLSCTRIVRLNAFTISTRLERLSLVENSDALKTSEKFLWIVLHFNNISKIKRILEDLKIQFSLNTFLTTFEDNAIQKCCKKEIQLRNSMSQKRDLFSYLSLTFGDSVQAIKEDLEHNLNINFSSVQNAQKVLKYLASKGVTQKQLRNGLGIVLYKADVVMQYFTDFPSRQDLQRPLSEWIKHPNLIQALIYLIEEDHNFLGNGVHVENAKSDFLCDEEEEMLLMEDIALNAELP